MRQQSLHPILGLLEWKPVIDYDSVGDSERIEIHSEDSVGAQFVHIVEEDALDASGNLS